MYGHTSFKKTIFCKPSTCETFCDIYMMSNHVNLNWIIRLIYINLSYKICNRLLDRLMMDIVFHLFHKSSFVGLRLSKAVLTRIISHDWKQKKIIHRQFFISMTVVIFILPFSYWNERGKVIFSVKKKKKETRWGKSHRFKGVVWILIGGLDRTIQRLMIYRRTSL